ncbi:MAG: hypothetical protein AB2814_02375, partial [Candidatus Sedimenticola endophacoides]
KSFSEPNISAWSVNNDGLRFVAKTGRFSKKPVKHFFRFCMVNSYLLSKKTGTREARNVISR